MNTTQSTQSTEYRATDLQAWKNEVRKQWPSATYRTVGRTLIAIHDGAEVGRWNHKIKRGYIAQA